MSEVMGKGSLEGALAPLLAPFTPHTRPILSSSPVPHTASPVPYPAFPVPWPATDLSPVATVHARGCGLIVVPGAHRGGLQDSRPVLSKLPLGP